MVAGEFGECGVRVVAEEERVVAEAGGAAWGVEDRMNAQSSCAGHVVEKHLAKEYRGEYAHIDIAGPAWDGERATGYGAVLLDAICRLAKA